MSLQYVGGNTATKAGATSGNSTISLTALTGGISSSAAAGDIVIAVFATGSTADRTLSITDGTTAYTLIATELYANGTTNDTNLRVAYKRLTAADASVTFGPTGNNADAGAMAVHVWRGADSINPLDVAATTATGTGTGRPNPAAITPTTTGTVIIIAGGASAATGAVFTASYLSNFRTVTSADTQDAMVGIGSIAWTSGTYDGAQWTGGTTNAADSWAAVTIALKDAVDQTLTPSLFTNTNTFYAATVTQAAGVQDLSPSLYTNTNTFYAGTITLGPAPQTLTAGLYTNTNTFYSPSATTSYTLQSSLYSNSNAFYSATVNVGTVTLTANLYQNTNTFYSPIISQGGGPQDINVNLFTNTNAFYSPRIDVQLFAGYYENTQQFYTATVGTSYALTADRFDNSTIFYTPTVDIGGGAQTLTPSLFSNTTTFYSATVDIGPADQWLVVQRLNNTNTFYPLSINRQAAENVLQGYFENRHRPPKKQEVEVPDYDEELAVLLLMS